MLLVKFNITQNLISIGLILEIESDLKKVIIHCLEVLSSNLHAIEKWPKTIIHIDHPNVDVLQEQLVYLFGVKCAEEHLLCILAVQVFSPVVTHLLLSIG
jgi:hypothetical protein